MIELHFLPNFQSRILIASRNLQDKYPNSLATILLFVIFKKRYYSISMVFFGHYHRQHYA